MSNETVPLVEPGMAYEDLLSVVGWMVARDNGHSDGQASPVQWVKYNGASYIANLTNQDAVNGRNLLALDSDGATIQLRVNKAGLYTDKGFTIGGTLAVYGNFTVGNPVKFTVLAASGNTDIDGTLNVDGATTLISTLNVTGVTTLQAALGVLGDVVVGAGPPKFTIGSSTGNTAILGTLDVTGNVSIGTSLNKFTIAGTTGNTLIAGTLGVTGATTLNALLNVVAVGTPTTPALYADPSTVKVSIGKVGPLGGTNERFLVDGGRAYFNPTNETLAIGVRYGSGSGTAYIGATNAASPDLLISNAAGNAIAEFLNARNMVLTAGDYYATNTKGYYSRTSGGAAVALAIVNGSDNAVYGTNGIAALITGDAIHLQRDGTTKLIAESAGVRLPNAVPLIGRNVGDSASVNLIKITASDVIESGATGTRHSLLGTVVAPDIDPPTVDGQVTQYAVAKAYANIYWNAGAAELKHNYNVSSISDDGTGLVTINWDKDFSDAYYALTVGMFQGTTLDYQVTAKSASAVTIQVYHIVTLAAADPVQLSVHAFGNF